MTFRTLLRNGAFFLTAVLAVFCCGIWTLVYAGEQSSVPGVLTVAMLDVGQGDALYIESPTGVQVLIDSGADASVLAALSTVMPALDYSLDAIVATHPDADHIGGFDDVLTRYDVNAYVYPGITKNSATARALETLVDEKEITRVLARRGMTLELGGGAVLHVLYPEGDVSYLPSEKANEGSVVLQLTYGESEMLFMADVGTGVERRLMALDAPGLRSDVLKVGHHGSKYSSAEDFLRAVSPDVALISVGKRNTYGHPTTQTLSRLQTVGAEVLRTDELGTVVLHSGGYVWSRK